MSRDVKKMVLCPVCDKETPTQLWPNINASQSPQLRAAILSGALFTFQCSHCHAQRPLAYPCLYHDQKRQFMVYLIPGNEQAVIPDEAYAPQELDLSLLRRRVVNDENDLKEKILIFEADLDDRAVELSKLMAVQALEKRMQRPIVGCYFTALDGEKGRMELTFFPEGSDEAFHKHVRLEVLRKCTAIVRAYDDGENAQGFLKVDAGWAAQCLRRYQGEGSQEQPEEA